MTDNIKKILPDIQDHYIFKDYGFRLIGGTALSYHIEHRLSEDLDFCQMGKLPRKAIEDFIMHCINTYGREKVKIMQHAQEKFLDHEVFGEDPLDDEQDWMINNVKVTFFNGAMLRGVKDIFNNDKCTKIGNINISSVDAIFEMKSLMFYDRAKSRDYYDLFYMYEYNGDKYSIEKTVSLIQKYELSYQGKEGFELFLDKVKNANYSKMYDEPLMGLVDIPEEFPVLQKKMLELLNSIKM